MRLVLVFLYKQDFIFYVSGTFFQRQEVIYKWSDFHSTNNVSVNNFVFMENKNHSQLRKLVFGS